MDEPMGTPKSLAAMAESVSCHVHQRNLMPAMS